ncbi:MAG: orotidine-5'-phosphate decarboxylase [Patescibacteria group bacterium]
MEYKKMITNRYNSTYKQRGESTNNKMAQRVFGLMDDKKTNLAVAADIARSDELISLVEKIGPEIVILKTHIDIIEDFTPGLIAKLIKLAKIHNFLIFEDRKFADIGNTVQMQYQKGVYQIASWADMVNAHIIPGPGIIEGLKEIADGQDGPRGLILLAQMSSKGNLATDEYTAAAINMAEEYSDFVMGFIGNGGDIKVLKELDKNTSSEFIIMTPGVKLGGGGDGLKQQYTTPADVIAAGSDIIIVGRGIYGAKNPTEEAKKYRQTAWESYEKRINK